LSWMTGPMVRMTEQATTSALRCDGLVKLLEMQQTVYERINDQHDQQRAWLDAGDHESLASSLHGRQKLVDRAIELNEQIAPYRNDWQSFVAALTEAERTMIDGFVRRIAELQEQVMQQDAALANDVRSQRDGVNVQRTKVVAASRAVNAYRTAADRTNRYTDREG